MPREVFLDPNGSPFVHGAPFNHDQTFGGDSTLTDLSFQDNDNLLNASGFAGLADVTAGGIGDDTSMMKMPGVGSESGDMLMGVKGDEFLADDSMAFELSKSSTTRTRSKLEQSTTAPPAPAPAPLEEEEKPKRRKSTRSRSSSPSKKRSSAATTPVVEEAPAFPTTQMETMPEEPEPESEPKLRRSPRKARSTSTRMGSISTGPSPFASTSSQPSSQPTPEKTAENAQTESSPAPETLAEPEPAPEPKTKRSSRTVGRSKSKSRAKSARVEEPLNEESPKAEEPAPVAEPAVSTPVVEREATPVARETTPTNARQATPVPPQSQTTLPASSPAPAQTTPATTSQSPVPVQATSQPAAPIVPPTNRPVPTARHSMAPIATTRPTPAPTTRQSLAPAPASRQSLAPTPDPAPFKFNLPPSFGNRAQSLAPTPVTPSHAPGFSASPFPLASTPSASNPVSALPSPALALATPGPAIASDSPSATAPEGKDDLTYEQLSKEEEEEAVAAAMRITRRDSSIFGLMSPLRAPFAREQDVGMDGVESGEENTTGAIGGNADGRIIESNANEGTTTEGSMENNATGADAQGGNVPATEPAPVPKRTRVGRGSTRGRGGAAVAVAVMGRVAEDEDIERVEALVEPQGEEQERALEEQQYEQAVLEEEKHVIDEPRDAAIPVNFGSRSPSPTPPPPPPEGPAPSTNSVTGKPKPLSGTRTRTTRASMPTVQPARATRSTRRSEVQQPTTRSLGTTTAVRETLIEKPTKVEEGVQNDNDKPTEDVSTPTRAADPATTDSTTPLEPISATHDAISTTPLDSPVVPAPEPAAPQKASGTKGSQRVATRAASATVASQRAASGSGSSQSQPRRAAPAAHKPASGGSAKPPSTGSAKPPSTGAKPASTEGPQRAGGPGQKPDSTKVTAPRKADKPHSVTKGDAVGQESAPVPDPDAPKNEPEPEVRAVRALPKRASRSSQVPTIMEDSMEISREEIGELDAVPAQTTPVPNAEPASMFASIWPREPAPNPFAPVNTSVTFNDDGPRTNKRRAPSSEPELESTPQATDSNDSPNKRVRFTAVLEAGPTPGVGRVLHMPKPSLKKVKKFRIERKASGTANAGRPKRVLTRDWVVGHTPSYAAPLRRDVREREATTAERPPLAESQTNNRATTSKLNPTVPIPFTFRSELRMKSQPTEGHHFPAAIPIAAPMPDFAAAHAAAEAANLTRRQRAQEVFLAAQAELESYRDANYAIGGETARRAAERAVFDAAMKVREAEAERIRNEQKKLEKEKEAAEIRDIRRRMVPRANPVPEFYKYAPRNDAQDLEA